MTVTQVLSLGMGGWGRANANQPGLRKGNALPTAGAVLVYETDHIATLGATQGVVLATTGSAGSLQRHINLPGNNHQDA